MTGFVLSMPAYAGKTDKTAIAYIKFSESEGVVRVKPAAGIATKASCQTTSYMVIPLSDPNLKLKLTVLYTAAATKDAVVRLFGNDDCSVSAGSEAILDVTVFPPET